MSKTTASDCECSFYSFNSFESMENGDDLNKISLLISHNEYPTIIDSISNLSINNNYLFEQKGDESQEETCGICFENLRNSNNQSRTLLCTHSFHIECIEDWQKRSLTCPICRRRHSTFLI